MAARMSLLRYLLTSNAVKCTANFIFLHVPSVHTVFVKIDLE